MNENESSKISIIHTLSIHNHKHMIEKGKGGRIAKVIIKMKLKS
uniref:Uncharacterized protein n=1 Tax=Picea sitchensis TaxID=3332 RepID=D5A8X2_PICSI|nr:unknown [Picea sitchensis]